jgi:tetratricopeptide (TPR) repeat protein
MAADDPQNLAVRYQLVVDYKAAMNAAGERLAKMAPDSEFTHAMKAEALSDGDRLDDAILEFRQVLRKDPDFPGIHFALGQVYWKKKDNANALGELKLALQEEPNQPLANYYAGDMLVDEQKFQEAIPHLKIAVSVYPELARARFLLGKSYGGVGDSQAALLEFQEALRLDPDYKEVHFQLYELYARLGDKEKSQEHLRISERLTREGQERDRARLQDSLEKQKNAGDKP